MPLLFVYGSLKQGFANEHVNTGKRVAGRYRTRDAYPMFLLGEGEVPCVIAAPGTGSRIAGELYEATADDIARMDRLERIGDADGYERWSIAIERFDASPVEQLQADIYVKQPHVVPAGTPRIGPLDEYRQEHAGRFNWQGKA